MPAWLPGCRGLERFPLLRRGAVSMQPQRGQGGGRDAQGFLAGGLGSLRHGDWGAALPKDTTGRHGAMIRRRRVAKSTKGSGLK